MRFRKILVLLIISFFIFACNSDSKLKQGKETVIKIENFRIQKNRLPNSLNEIGIEESESGPIYYRKEDETKYIVWFGKELGESTTYDSETKQWK